MHYQNQNNSLHYSSATCFGVCFPSMAPTRDIEQVQRRTAHFAYSCYQDNSPGCVTNLLNSLQWESLQQRRWKQTLVMCYKIHHQLIAIEPANYYTAGDSRTRGNQTRTDQSKEGHIPTLLLPEIHQGMEPSTIFSCRCWFPRGL
jgi:hypothetical protein